MVAANTVKTEGGKVSYEAPEGPEERTMINVILNLLDGLLDNIKTVRVRKMKKVGRHDTPTNETYAKEPLVVGVCFICLGCFNVMLGVVIAFVHPSLDIYDFGVHFWVGFPFIISGILNIVAYKNPKAKWEIDVFLSLLCCLFVTSAGLVFLHRDLTSIWWRNDMAPMYDEVHQSYPYLRIDYVNNDNRNEADWNLEHCKSGFRQYQNLLFGLVVMSSIIIASGLSIIIIALYHSLQMIPYSCIYEQAEENEDDPLLSPNPTQYIAI